MKLNLTEARRFWQLLPTELKSPYHAPDYVAIDAGDKRATAEPFFYGFQKGGEKYFHPLHCIVTESLNVVDLESARGYGGPVSTTTNIDFLAEAHLGYETCIKELGVMVEFVRFSPVLQNDAYYAGTVVENRQTCGIDLSDYSLQHVGGNSRGNIRKAIANGCELVVHDRPDSATVRAFYVGYRQRMVELNASDDYFYSEDYFQSLLTKNTLLAQVVLGNKVLSQALFLLTDFVLEYHLSYTTREGMTLGATNFLLHQMALRQQGQQQWFHLGGGLTRHEDDPLYRFKKRAGSLSFLYKTGYQIFDTTQYMHLRGRMASLDPCYPERTIFYRD